MSDLGNKEIMAENIKYYLKLKGVQPSDVYTALGFAPATFSDWMHARTYPRIDKIEMMSNYFGINKADLVERKTEASINAIRSAKLVKKFEMLEERDKQIIENMIEQMLPNSSDIPQ